MPHSLAVFALKTKPYSPKAKSRSPFQDTPTQLADDTSIAECRWFVESQVLKKKLKAGKVAML
jgi:hypothetical protein